jgi:hypothetical protein
VGGGASDTLRLAIGLPAPTITTLSPASTTATLGDRARVWTLTVNGTLFDDQAKVVVNGQQVYTEFVSATRLRAVLPDSMQTTQARRTVQVRNTPLLQSNIVNLTVHNPTPVLTGVEPSTIIAGRDTVLTLTGDRFAPDATVRLVFGTTTTVVAPSRRDSVIRITIPLPSSRILARGAYSVQVVNRGLALDTTTVGGGADALTLTVNPDALHSVHYENLDTLISAGGNLPQFVVRSATVYKTSLTTMVRWCITAIPRGHSLGTSRLPASVLERIARPRPRSHKADCSVFGWIPLRTER